jgi:uncharacterized protein YecT (DUF1311 family)
MTRIPLALTFFAAFSCAGVARADQPSAADITAVKACTDLVKNNVDGRPPHGDDEFEEKVGPAGRLAGAAKLASFDAGSCIGILATACVQKIGEIAREVDFAECRDRETKVWDKRLNEAYRRAQNKMEKEALENLRKVQRAWIAFRDVSCRQSSATFQGTMAGPMESYCLMNLTARQAIWMENWADNAGR